MDPHCGTFSSVVFWWLLFAIISYQHQFGGVMGQTGICEMKGCKCLEKFGAWRVVNCTFGTDQDVTFEASSIHQRLLEIFIIGGKMLIFKERSFNALPGLSILYISNANEILIKKHSFYNSSSPSLRLEIENCDKLLVESEAFINSNSTIIVDVNKANYCIVMAAAFSKLVNATFQNINKLSLVERSFEITKKDGIFRHGPATKITFIKVRMASLPTKTFFSSLAEIRIQDSEIDEIHSKAFSATQITSIYLWNTTINSINSDACSSNSLIENLKISRCNISRLESKAVTCAVSTLSIRNSRINDIETGAINTTSAYIDLTGNEIVNFKASAMGFISWNKIVVEQNMIKNLGANSIEIHEEPSSRDNTHFSFVNNDIFNLDMTSLSFLSYLEEPSITFKDNYFNIQCHCFLSQWFENLTKTNRSTKTILDTSYCTVDDLLARCYELKSGIFNMLNFTELVCSPGNVITCEHYNGEEKIVNITNPVFLDSPKPDNSWLILTLSIAGLVIISIVVTLIFLLISGGRWLKRKGYFRNMHYSPNETSNDEENTIVTVDQDSEEHHTKFDLPEELTLEYLEYLKKRLDDPNTHQETSEMIERLYEMFIIEDNYENNNRNDEETHLYEELANMQTQMPQERKSMENLQNGPLSILKMMEERFNLQFIDTNEDERGGSSATAKRPIVNEYSEPSDAAVHLYSELRQNQVQNEQNEKMDSLTLGGGAGGMMSSRPLPNKPDDFYAKAGPSSID